MKINKDRFWKKIKDTGLLIAGNFILAFLVAAFILPHDIIMGGATGVSIILGKFLPVDTATIVLVVNICMLLLGSIVLGKKFLLSTIASSFLFPFFLGALQRIPGIESLTDNTLMATLFAGGLLGLALGMIMGMGASSGGVDAFNLVMNKWFHVPLSVAVYLTDTVILLGQALFSDPEHILYGILAIVIESFVMDQVLLIGQSQLQILVITEKFEELRRELLFNLEAGVTMMHIETGYAGQEQKGVMCVIPKRKLHAATELIQTVDPAAFVTITQIKEVRGQGFSRERQPVEQHIDMQLPET